MKIDIPVRMEVSASFRLLKFKENEEITYVGEPFHNTVLNTGLDLMVSDSIATLCQYVNLGSSSTPVDVTQTGLLDRKFGTNTAFNNTAGPRMSYYPTYYAYYKLFQFNIGTCTGSFTEIGLSKASNSGYLNRQLIKDSDGNPITLTVAADEGLRIGVEIRVTFGSSFKPFSQIYKLDMKGATAGTITFAKGATTKTITWANMTTTTDLFGGYSVPNKAYGSFIEDLNTLDTIMPVIQVIKDPADGNYLIMCNPANPTSMGLSISSHTLTGGTGAPTLTEVQVFESQITTGTWQHTNETTLEVTTINYSLYPVVQNRSCAWNGNHGLWGAYVEWHGAINYPLGKWWLGVLGQSSGPSSTSQTELVYSDVNTKKRTLKYYWGPGVLSSSTITISALVIHCGGTGFYDSGRIFYVSISPSIVITNSEEFEVSFSLYWGRPA